METLRTWIGRLRRGLLDLVDGGCLLFGAAQVTNEARWGVYFVFTAAIIPWVVLALLRRGRPYDMGLRRPNRVGWRIVVVGWVLAFPFQVWMVRSATFADYYEPQLQRAGTVSFLLYYFVIMLVEHFYFHGVLLATCRAGGRWPGPAQVVTDAGTRRGRVLQWLGLGQPVGGATGVTRLTRWLGLQHACVLPIVVSGLLFAAVHLGKNPRELVLSVPGGIAMGYVSYRTNSWLIPFLLHALTGGTACVLMLLM